MFTNVLYCCWRCGSRAFHVDPLNSFNSLEAESGTYRMCTRCGHREVEDLLLMAIFNVTNVYAANAIVIGGK